MNLQQIHDLVASKTAYTRPDVEIWAAISGAGKRMHQNVCKEFRGYWIKWDYTSIQTAIGQDEYRCPADLGQIIRFSEKMPSETVYRQMQPADITSDFFAEKEWQLLIAANCGPSSDFVFYGPYLDQFDANLQSGSNPQPQYYKVRLAPKPQDVRTTEIIYAARYIEIVNAQSPNVIPMEGHDVQFKYAVAELWRSNNDSLAMQYEQQAEKEMAEFLTWARSRQIFEYPVQETYIGDLD